MAISGWGPRERAGCGLQGCDGRAGGNSKDTKVRTPNPKCTEATAFEPRPIQTTSLRALLQSCRCLSKKAPGRYVDKAVGETLWLFLTTLFQLSACPPAKPALSDTGNIVHARNQAVGAQQKSLQGQHDWQSGGKRFSKSKLELSG